MDMGTEGQGWKDGYGYRKITSYRHLCVISIVSFVSRSILASCVKCFEQDVSFGQFVVRQLYFLVQTQNNSSIFFFFCEQPLLCATFPIKNRKDQQVYIQAWPA